jgi:hypothetical protein
MKECVKVPYSRRSILELGRDLMGARGWSVGAVGESGQAAGFVAGDPVVDALTCDTEPIRDLGDFPAILDNGHDCLIPLFHDAQLHQHFSPPGPTVRSVSGDDEVSKISRNCQTSPGTPVKDQPEHDIRRWVARESNPEPTD